MSTRGTEISQKWAERRAKVVLHTYHRQPVAFVRGSGARLWDVDGNEYIDFCAGIAVSTLGHGHAGLAAAIADQAAKLLHVSNLYEVPEQIELAERLREFTGFDRFFFCNSGAEANEAAIKLARAWGNPRRRSRIIVARDGFHGRTLGALSATAQERHRAPFEPLLQGFDVVDFGDAEALAQVLDDGVAAVLIEPIQAEGGGRFPPPGYLARVRELCDQAGALLILDEVQTGMGRTGKPLYSTGLVEADVVSLAKGLGGGVPIGAIGVRERLADALGPGMHASTFGGNPLACRAALVVLAELARPQMLAQVRELGDALRTRLAGWNDSGISAVRGEGQFTFFDVPDSAALVRSARDNGLLLAPAKGNTVRIVPPLTLTPTELADGLERLSLALRALEVRA